MLEELKEIKTDKKQLRRFALTIGFVLGALGALFLWQQKSLSLFFLTGAEFFLIVGLPFPGLLKPFYFAWMALSLLVGWLMTRVILVLLFYFILTPIGFLARVFGKEFLDAKIDPQAATYWLPKEKIKAKRADYKRQF